MSRRLQHILLVEDDPDIRSILTLALTAFGGFTVTAVADGQAGVVAATATAPDLAILDFMMPGMNGLEALEALRRIDASMAALPAVFITAAATGQRMTDISDPAVLGVIAKPFDAVGLAAEIHRMWEAHQSRL